MRQVAIDPPEQSPVSDFLVDLSRAWKTTTAADIHRIGAFGALPYTGCDDTSKNISAERLAEYLAADLWCGLFIENAANAFGNGAGKILAAHVLTGARSIGYDVDHCVLLASADWNATTERDYAGILSDWNAYADVVPIPGYYGDSDSMDYLFEHAMRPPYVCIQSESGSFSPEHPSPHANIWQRYQDPRAGGLDVDVDDILFGPLFLMGAIDMTPDEHTALFNCESMLNSIIGVAPGQTSTGGTISATLTTAQSLINKVNAIAGAIQNNNQSVSSALTTIEAALKGVQAGQIDPAGFVAAIEAAGVPLELATDLAAHLKLQAA